MYEGRKKSFVVDVGKAVVGFTYGGTQCRHVTGFSGCGGAAGNSGSLALDGDEWRRGVLESDARGGVIRGVAVSMGLAAGHRVGEAEAMRQLALGGNCPGRACLVLRQSLRLPPADALARVQCWRAQAPASVALAHPWCVFGPSRR
jgi:hypothetical protein